MKIEELEALRWYTPVKVAPMLGMSVDEVRALCERDLLAHQIRVSRDGRHFYRISNQAVVQWLEKNTRKAHRPGRRY